MQATYEVAVEDWIAAITQEETLASVNHTIAELDKWEAASFKKDDLRNEVKAAKNAMKTHCAKSSSASRAW